MPDTEVVSLSRRAALLAVPVGLWQAPLSEPASSPKTDERTLRYRMETVDAVFRRAKSAREQQKVPFRTYESIVGLLREEEMQIEAEAKACEFQDLTEHNYWRRGRLKFPSALLLEVQRLREGHDPALPRR
ncbi:MAG: hypothetical protein IPP47_25485 [Bryobacterales bacterium]|nr:hypothetical protein [Bryobacterales bacterium]